MSLSREWALAVDPSVLKTLKKIPKRDSTFILEVIRLLPQDPYFGDIQKMKGVDDAWRRRAGSYRIFYKLNLSDNTIIVFHLERRTSKTY